VGTEAYLAAWRTSEWQSDEGNPEALVDELVAKLEGEYTDERLLELQERGGYAASG
jgi:hypothetical protein